MTRCRGGHCEREVQHAHLGHSGGNSTRSTGQPEAAAGRTATAALRDPRGAARLRGCCAPLSADRFVNNVSHPHLPFSDHYERQIFKAKGRGKRKLPDLALGPLTAQRAALPGIRDPCRRGCASRGSAEPGTKPPDPGRAGGTRRTAPCARSAVAAGACQSPTAGSAAAGRPPEPRRPPAPSRARKPGVAGVPPSHPPGVAGGRSQGFRFSRCAGINK